MESFLERYVNQHEEAADDMILPVPLHLWERGHGPAPDEDGVSGEAITDGEEQESSPEPLAGSPSPGRAVPAVMVKDKGDTRLRNKSRATEQADKPPRILPPVAEKEKKTAVQGAERRGKIDLHIEERGDLFPRAKEKKTPPPSSPPLPEQKPAGKEPVLKREKKKYLNEIEIIHHQKIIETVDVEKKRGPFAKPIVPEPAVTENHVSGEPSNALQPARHVPVKTDAGPETIRVKPMLARDIPDPVPSHVEKKPRHTGGDVKKQASPVSLKHVLKPVRPTRATEGGNRERSAPRVEIGKIVVEITRTEPRETQPLRRTAAPDESGAVPVSGNRFGLGQM